MSSGTFGSNMKAVYLIFIVSVFLLCCRDQKSVSSKVVVIEEQFEEYEVARYTDWKVFEDSFVVAAYAAPYHFTNTLDGGSMSWIYKLMHNGSWEEAILIEDPQIEEYEGIWEPSRLVIRLENYRDGTLSRTLMSDDELGAYLEKIRVELRQYFGVANLDLAHQKWIDEKENLRVSDENKLSLPDSTKLDDRQRALNVSWNGLGHTLYALELLERYLNAKSEQGIVAESDRAGG
ncbi:hypothetical protein AAFN60_04150 [Roseibacillus persicicus]|uniref:hypothetical protein n=1 Tax=Roseibacillus persicicus TaxID=454148 RepID=UPI00398A8EAD